MSAAVIPSTSDHRVTTPHSSELNGTLRAKRRRVARRRGRAKHGMDSDDEIEREVRTDSESEDDLSSSGSSSDSDTEPVSEDVLSNDQPRVLTPSTSQSPEGPGKEVHVVVNAHNDSFFGKSGDWSEMVAEEAARGPESLPVLDFSELDSQVLQIPTQPRRTKKSTKHGRHASTTSIPSTSPSQPPDREGHGSHEVTQNSHAQRRRSPRRAPGQTARQAYQQRLEVDPSYVPTVGEFWGHDDRLLDKDLRSLSGWWRGRWQNGFRGRGGFRGSVRGRGGYMGQVIPGSEVEQEGPLPPVDRAWTHDGFEEMKHNDDSSSYPRKPVQPQSPVRAPSAARGSYAGRGGRARGALSPSSRARRIAPLDPSRVWFMEKPEHVWTKQAESFLYFDSSSKPRAGDSATIRVKLPNQKTPVRVLIQQAPPATTFKSSGTATFNVDSEYGDRALIVRMPKHSEAAVPVAAARKSTKKSTNTHLANDSSIEDVFTVRPRLVSSKPIPLPEPTNRKSSISPPNITHNVSTSISSIDPVIQQKLEQVSIEPRKSDPAQWKQTEEAVMRNPSGNVPEDLTEDQSAIPSMHFASPQSSSPAYGSPYHYAPSLPPGVAINSVGVTYEVATGRPVYLPTPSTIYMQPTSFVPGHVHHPSSEFIPAGTPPLNGYVEYIPPRPIFPRKSARIEIRAPDGSVQNLSASVNSSTNTKEAVSPPSQLRSDAAPFSPFEQQQYLSTESSEEQYTAEGMELQHQVQDPMMGYAAYNPYYYPEPYVYNPYIDMSQVTPYEMYAPPQGTVYYH